MTDKAVGVPNSSGLGSRARIASLAIAGLEDQAAECVTSVANTSRSSRPFASEARRSHAEHAYVGKELRDHLQVFHVARIDERSAEGRCVRHDHDVD